MSTCYTTALFCFQRSYLGRIRLITRRIYLNMFSVIYTKNRVNNTIAKPKTKIINASVFWYFSLDTINLYMDAIISKPPINIPKKITHIPHIPEPIRLQYFAIATR